MTHAHQPRTSDNIRVAFFLNLAFTVLEIVGGVWTNSLAILSDAIHDLGDSLSLGLAWYLDRYAAKEMDHRFTYGYRRFSLVGALFNTIILILGSIFILSRAIPCLMHPEQPNAQGMVLFAIVGIVVNGLAVYRLRENHSMNARLVALHLLEDVFGWLAVLIVAGVLLFVDAFVLDPILSILISAFVLYKVARSLRETLALFLQAVPESLEIVSVEHDLSAIALVQSCHHTHIWSLDGEHNILTTHVVVPQEISKEDILCLKADIREELDKYGFTHVTVEIEFGEDDCGLRQPITGLVKG